MAHSRRDYMSRKCTHREYYSQFVTAALSINVAQCIGEDALFASKDEHFNDIPLSRWDALAECLRPAIPNEYGDGRTYYSLSNAVCILKEAARQFVDEI